MPSAEPSRSASTRAQHRLEIVDVAVHLVAEIGLVLIMAQDLARLARFEQPHRAAGEDAAVALEIGGPGGVADLVREDLGDVDRGRIERVDDQRHPPRQSPRRPAPRARPGPRRSGPRSPRRSRRWSAIAGSAARSPPCAVASARCEALPISASCSCDRRVERLAERARGSPRPGRRRSPGSPRRSPRGHGSPPAAAASRTRTSASTSSGPVSLDQLRRRAVGLADRGAERPHLLLGLARAFAQRGEQGVERLALARRCSPRSPATCAAALAAAASIRSIFADHRLGRGRGALGLDLDPGHGRRHLVAQLRRDLGQSARPAPRRARSARPIAPGPGRSRAAAPAAVSRSAPIDWTSRAFCASPLSPTWAIWVPISSSWRAIPPSRVRLAGSWLASRPASISILLPGHVEPLGERLGRLGAGLLEGGPALLDHRQHRLALRLEARRAPVDRFGRLGHRAVDRGVHLRRRLVHPLGRGAGAAFDPGDMGAEPLRRAARHLVRLAAAARPARRAGLRARRPARARRGRPASSPRRRRAPAPRPWADRSSARRHRSAPLRRPCRAPAPCGRARRSRGERVAVTRPIRSDASSPRLISRAASSLSAARLSGEPRRDRGEHALERLAFAAASPSPPR